MDPTIADNPSQPAQNGATAPPPASEPNTAESAGERLRDRWRAELERWSTVSAHIPLHGAGPLAAVALSRRAARYLLRWYINPIVEQQNGFNAAAVRLDALDRARERELAREIRLLQERVAALEAQLTAQTEAQPATAGERPDPRA